MKTPRPSFRYVPPFLFLACFATPVAGDLLASAPSAPNPVVPAGAVLARREVWRDGRRLAFVRIQKPDIPRRPVAPPPPEPELSAEELARQVAREAKLQHGLTFFGGVHPGNAATPRLTELRLERREGDALRVARVWLPLDLRLVDAVGALETTDAVFYFTILLAATVFDGPPAPEHAPVLALWAPGAAGGPDAVPDYVFEGDADDEAAFADALRGLELLLAHERLHRPELAARLAEREAEAARRAREAELHPPAPANTTLRFWPKTFPAR